MSVMKWHKDETTRARSVELFVDVHIVKRHAIVDVLCRPVVSVVIGVHIVAHSVPLVVVHVVPIFLVVILYQFIPLFSVAILSHIFSLHFQGILGVVFTHTVGYCVECDIVQSDHAPEAGVAQGIFHGDLIRHQGGHQEELGEELEEEVERRVKREHSSNQTQVRMHG